MQLIYKKTKLNNKLNIELKTSAFQLIIIKYLVQFFLNKNFNYRYMILVAKNN